MVSNAACIFLLDILPYLTFVFCFDMQREVVLLAGRSLPTKDGETFGTLPLHIEADLSQDDRFG